MGEKMECKPACPRDGIVGSGSPTLDFMSFDTKNQGRMLKLLRNVNYYTHDPRHHSSFIPVIVSGKKYRKGTCLAPRLSLLLWEIREVIVLF